MRRSISTHGSHAGPGHYSARLRQSRWTAPPVFLTLAAALLLSPLAGAPTEPDATDSDAQWQALLSEAEETLEWSADPLADLGLEPEPVHFWTFSLRGGGGASDNFLKRRNAVGSSFLKAEADAYLNALFDHASLTLLAFAEYIRYAREARADSETTAFLHLNWTRNPSRPFAFGAELDAFYGDQIYDASLVQNGAPVGASLRQFRPEAAIFTEWQPADGGALRLRVAARRAEFAEKEDNYWRPIATLGWRRHWSAAWETETRLSAYQDRYDEDHARGPTGLELIPQRSLVVDGASLDGSLAWQPVQAGAFKATLRLGIALEDETHGDYKDLLRHWGSLSVRHDFGMVELQATTRWQQIRYRERQVGFIDDRRQRQDYRSLKLEAHAPLPWNTALRLAVEWSRFNSRIDAENFSERRVEAAVEWAY
jgi:hypothetical protein